MSENRAFWKALHSLSHPLSVLAILLLLFNDHYLRHHYPSWLSGKLGDFTWLIFAPFIAAMLFSWLAPQKPRLIGIVSIAFIGLWFALFKTVPFVMEITKDALSFLVGWRGSLGMDVSDLLTLPALGLSWTIWQNAPENKQYLRPVIYVAFALGMLGTLASDSASYSAVLQICESADGTLYTSTSYYYSEEVYSESNEEMQVSSGTTVDYWESHDGGLNWHYLGQIDEETLGNARCSDSNSLNAANPQNARRYRWQRGEKIEYSVDNGTSWFLLRDLFELRQDAREHLNHNDGDALDSHYYSESPVAGLVHSQTGNLVLAMSRDGVLVIQPSGESYWAGIGEYALADLSDWAQIQRVLGFYTLLVPTLFFLVLVSAIVLIHSELLLTRIWLGLGWLSWLILLVLFRSASLDLGNISLFWGLLALVSLLIIAVPMILWALYHLLWHYRSVIISIIVAGLLTCLANFFPVFLWSQGTIPRYDVAVLFSLFLTAAVLAAMYSYFRPKLPLRFIAEKTKRKNDDTA